jgi:hypothetical protein
MMEETKVVQGSWELSTFHFNIEARGINLMLEGFKDKKLVGIRCHQCGMVYLPGPFYCRKCHVKIDEPVEISDHGTVRTYTIQYADIRGNPMPEPRVSAMVQFDGCDSWVMGVVRCDPKDIHVGMRVKVKWKDQTIGNMQDMEAFVPE